MLSPVTSVLGSLESFASVELQNQGLSQAEGTEMRQGGEGS